LLEDLARRLRLAGPPRAIECYDVATLQGAMSAAAKVAFLDGEPHKEGYRLYKIRSVEGQDDFAMMREALSRRFRRAVSGAEPPPDLVVVDGGKGQLAVAVEVLGELGVEGVALAALAKGKAASERSDLSDSSDASGRIPERLFLPGRKNPVVFPPHAPSFYLLQRLRDETHRFVNAYHRKLRAKAHLRSGLESVAGIGARRARALLRHFGSLARVREATEEALAAAPAMNAASARNVFLFLHPEGK